MPEAYATGFGAGLIKANDWLKTRLNNIDIFDEHFQREGQTNPFYALGSIFYLVWVVVMVTGLLLIIWYIPTKPAAFDSILRIQNEIPLGNIIRGMHKYGADAMIIAATMRMYRIFLSADYKPSREFNAAIGLITLLLAMYSGLTGYLLIWNQRAFWATKVFATFPTYMDQFPAMGDFYQPLVKSLHLGWNTAEFLLGGGGAITQETITRFYSLHIAFSLIPLIFVELYFYRTGYTRIALNWTKRLVVIAMLLIVSIILPAAIGARSNPDVTPLPILSDWYFLGLYQMYKYLEPVVATEITLLIPLTVMILPFLDVAITGPEKNIWKRPIILMTAIMAFANWVTFSALIIAGIANIHNDPPYWRCFLFVMVDIGMVWQLALVWATSDLQYRLRSASGAMVMGWLAAVQSLWALWYYFMARTEMFLSPILQSFAYFVFRPFMGGNYAVQAEQLARLGTKVNVPYWEWATTLQSHIDVPYKNVLLKVQELSGHHTPVDVLFQMIPTFIPGIRYQGLMDYMITNRWCADYAAFCDRMNGVTAPYPMPVPPLDWVWMLSGVTAMLLCFGTAYFCRRPAAAKVAAAPGKASSAAPAV